MSVSHCSIEAEDMPVEEAKTNFVPGISNPGNAVVTTAVGQLRAVAALCNAADFDASETTRPLASRKMFGDATDQAVLRFAERLEAGGVAYLRACWTQVFEVAFNSKNKFMIRCFTIGRREGLGHTLSEKEIKSFETSSL